MFSYNMENNITYATADSPKYGVTKDSIVGLMKQLSLGVNIPFLFQPDNTQQEFAWVKLNNKTLDIKQIAPQMYSIGFSLTEVW